VDGAYPSGEQCVRRQHAYQIDLIGPMRQDQSWQAHDAQAYDISRFQMDWEPERVTCPMGPQSQYWQPANGPRGKPTIQVLFPTKVCGACEVRARCTSSKTGPRELTLHPHAQHLAMQAARERQQTTSFQECDKRRAGIEGTISQAAFALGMRRTRYRGLRAAGIIVRFYTLRAQVLVRDRYREPSSSDLFAAIYRKYESLAVWVVCKRPEGC
jgi:transposase